MKSQDIGKALSGYQPNLSTTPLDTVRVRAAVAVVLRDAPPMVQR